MRCAACQFSLPRHAGLLDMNGTVGCMFCPECKRLFVPFLDNTSVFFKMWAFYCELRPWEPYFKKVWASYIKRNKADGLKGQNKVFQSTRVHDPLLLMNLDIRIEYCRMCVPSDVFEDEVVYHDRLYRIVWKALEPHVM